MAEYKAFDKLRKQAFACEADARKALADFAKKLKTTTVHDVEIKAVPRFKGKGRPAEGRKPDWFDYHVEGAMASSIQERTHRLQHRSCFILASNELSNEALSDLDLIAAYKNQQKVERGFRFLKDPMFPVLSLSKQWLQQCSSNRQNVSWH
jgi:transposase